MKSTIVATLLFFLTLSSFAQTENEVKAAVLHSDSLFWLAYNQCDLAGMQKFIATDVEFYHDKGGIQKGIDQFSNTTKKNLCGNSDFHLRREAVPGTVKVYVMTKDGVPYGAVLSGEHLFYVNEKGKKERLDGLAKFTHLWLYTDSAWKMSRILSYDHGPAPYINKRNEIELPESVLRKYAGNYKGPQTGPMTVTIGRNVLRLTIGKNVYELHPETQNRFFSIERDLEFEFKTGSNGKVEKMVVWENGAVAETAEAQK
jgi:hypothetical protein